MSYHTGLQVLRAKVRGFQAAGLTLSSRISTSRKERRSRFWNEKRALGVHCRYHLVAYGLLRGVPYDQIERCAPTNRLDPKRLLAIIEEHNMWAAGQGFVRYDLDTVKKLLEGQVGRWVKRSDKVAPEWIVSFPTTPSVAEATGSPEPCATSVVASVACLASAPSLLDRARSLLRKSV